MLSDTISLWFKDTWNSCVLPRVFVWRPGRIVEKTLQAPPYRQLRVLLKAVGKENIPNQTVLSPC